MGISTQQTRGPGEGEMCRSAPPRCGPKGGTGEVRALVGARFGRQFGRLRPFGWGVTRDDALAALDHFVRHALPTFGDEQDAMLADDPTLSHALVSPYINLGLLSPMEVCRRVEAEWQAGRVPINAAEGFIRQIIGWREYVRGLYWLLMPGYAQGNALSANRPLPAFYWGGETSMRCMAQAVGQTRDQADACRL